jgi:hypothetical protein
VSKIKEELLPWAAALVKENQPLQPPPELEKVVRIFTLFVGALTAAQFDEFMAKDVPFDAEERKVFIKLAEAFKLVPKGATSGTAATNPSTSSGGAAAP